MMTDPTYLLKLKQAGRTDEEIAKRLGISVDEVQLQWSKLMADLNAKLNCGFAQLCEAFKLMCHQYQQLGESFKVISQALSNPMSPDEIGDLLFEELKHDSSLEGVYGAATQNLLKNAIVLRPFAPKDPETN